jgi:hypothetical protein
MTPDEKGDSPPTDPRPSPAASDPVDQTPSVVRTAHTAPTSSVSARQSDTLLSAPPLTREDLELDERLRACERQIEDLKARIATIERPPAKFGPPLPSARWFWLVFLAGLALAWQILSHFR